MVPQSPDPAPWNGATPLPFTAAQLVETVRAIAARFNVAEVPVREIAGWLHLGDVRLLFGDRVMVLHSSAWSTDGRRQCVEIADAHDSEIRDREFDCETPTRSAETLDDAARIVASLVVAERVRNLPAGG